ncbi:hypothetical protein FBUS_01511 [Fasciolopsis buskii]|uniref:Uncharacterized protein n=1 Tax=Fasciolopsis buskii TaxID=27845 RepID=A0A8E0VIV2_9TREM|nr:hypothetical protein FBUS_01511 [Fasciolopsis buski]
MLLYHTTILFHCSIHVTNDNVWLVSNTHPRRVYTRLGLIHNVLKSPRSTDRVSRNLPAPCELQIGHAWQPIPPFDPVLHTLNVDCFVPVQDRRCGNLNGIDGPPIDALILTQSGDWLCLRISDEICLSLGPVLPNPPRSPSASSPELLDLSTFDQLI